MFLTALRFIIVLVRVRSLCLSDLSYSPDLAPILMSARIKGARPRARSYTSRRDSEIKLTAYSSILNNIPDIIMESKAHVSVPVAVTIYDSFGDNSDTETIGSARTSTVPTTVDWLN